jgi:hypothetical protein
MCWPRKGDLRRRELITRDLVAVIRVRRNSRAPSLPMRGSATLIRKALTRFIGPASGQRCVRVCTNRTGEYSSRANTLSEDWQGFMEGAVLTGEAAAKQLTGK